jgi:hypothetical protein
MAGALGFHFQMVHSDSLLALEDGADVTTPAGGARAGIDPIRVPMYEVVIPGSTSIGISISIPVTSTLVTALETVPQLDLPPISMTVPPTVIV